MPRPSRSGDHHGAGVGDAADEPLADLFWSVARRLRAGMRESLAPFDLAPSHFRALGVLLRHGPMRLRALSEHLRIAARSTTEVVDALEARGYARRLPDPYDRRATLVEPTDAARETMQALQAARSQDAERLFAGLDDADRSTLGRILRALRD